MLSTHSCPVNTQSRTKSQLKEISLILWKCGKVQILENDAQKSHFFFFLHEEFKSRVDFGNVVTRRVPAPWQRAAPFRACHHRASGKIQVGWIVPSALPSGPRAQRFPLVSSPKEISRQEKVRRRWWGARRSHDVVQRAGGRLLWLGDTEAGSKT